MNSSSAVGVRRVAAGTGPRATHARRLLVATWAAVAWALAVPPARALDFGLGIATTYDDNFLNYSNRDLFAFRYRLNPPRYGVKTTDDAVVSSYAEATWAPESTHMSVLARLEGDRYATNAIRNNLKASLQWRARLSHRWRLALGVGYVPDYYTRRYIDYEVRVPYPELSRYKDARYRTAEGAASVELRTAWRWRGQLGYAFGIRDYRGGFPERDENRHAVTLTVRPPHLGTLDARVRGTYGRAVARGPQGDVASGRPDVSNESFKAGLSLEWTPRVRNLGIAVRQIVEYEDRRYTTLDRNDASRFGRSIHELDLDWELAWAFARHWEVAAGYERTTQRLTGSLSNIETFTDASSYDRNRVTARLAWSTRGSRSE